MVKGMHRIPIHKTCQGTVLVRVPPLVGEKRLHSPAAVLQKLSDTASRLVEPPMIIIGDAQHEISRHGSLPDRKSENFAKRPLRFAHLQAAARAHVTPEQRWSQLWVH